MRGYRTSGVVIALLLSSAGTSAQAREGLEPIVPVPSSGNVAVARLVLQAPAGTAATPQLGIASRSSLPSEGYAVATIGRATGSGRFAATVAVVRPASTTSPPGTPEPSRSLRLRLPASWRLVSGPHWVNDVLYLNRRPTFGLLRGGTSSVLAGQKPAALSAFAVAADAQLLALDRSIPMAHARVLGLQYVSVAFPKRTGTTLTATIGLSGLTQVNAVELRFPTGVDVRAAAGPTGTEGLLIGNAVQLISSGRSFREGALYTFTLRLSRPPTRGDVVTVRASEHYFEGVLPFSERFVIG